MLSKRMTTTWAQLPEARAVRPIALVTYDQETEETVIGKDPPLRTIEATGVEATVIMLRAGQGRPVIQSIAQATTARTPAVEMGIGKDPPLRTIEATEAEETVTTIRAGQLPLTTRP
jgi:hypothetical protein